MTLARRYVLSLQLISHLLYSRCAGRFFSVEASTTTHANRCKSPWTRSLRPL